MTKNQNLLIVDDSEDDIELYRRFLRNDDIYGWTIFEAEDKEQTLEIVEQQEIHSILLDYSLPGSSGLKILTELRELKPFMPIIVLTGEGNEKVAVEAMRLNAQDYLVKNDVTPETLQKAIHNAIEMADLTRKISDQKHALQNFAAILAHDLKEPLRSITYFIERIEKELKQQMSSDIKRQFNFIVDAANRMTDLIETVSIFTYVENTETQSQLFNFSEVLENSLHNLDSVIRESNARITSEKLPDIYGDKTQLTQLLQNLLVNGIKYCTSGHPELYINAREEEKSWVFSVKDNGIGMDPKFLERIYEPFKRLHTAAEYSGSGLGLATCKKIIERHKGKIWCESKEGIGSVFFFSLPKRQDISDAEENTEPKISAQRGF